MRRILSMVLVLVVGVPLFACLISTANVPVLPQCCRRAGTHHCLEMSTQAGETVKVRALCPSYRRGTTTAPSLSGFFSARLGTSTTVSAKPLLIGQVEAGYRIALGRSGWKRGPPTLKL